jgi:hypothetical protein
MRTKKERFLAEGRTMAFTESRKTNMYRCPLFDVGDWQNVPEVSRNIMNNPRLVVWVHC